MRKFVRELLVKRVEQLEVLFDEPSNPLFVVVGFLVGVRETH
ncbi:uncharacterized protein HVO_1842 [Haloferax volcanii DS2]|uniref:Uncharacterized protein n=1 Tax=Haloferax volcanii (strain ATCC 29605 / DSM 3757 / JCM 8879 / NBRC 14742 / NCIMB 2012 / VKM B-1768 / DS2) TaxID=309800 RepID=D4GSU6_HALVD|nr:uncharacterized protein HVO_1842 [Haloferax volcanii DS2]